MQKLSTQCCSSKSGGVQEVAAIISFTLSQSSDIIASIAFFEAILIGWLRQLRTGGKETLMMLSFCSRGYLTQGRHKNTLVVKQIEQRQNCNIIKLIAITVFL